MLGCFLITVAIGWQGGWLLGAVTANCVGYMKEEWDKAGHGTYDKWDLVANAVGSLLGMALLIWCHRPIWY